MFFQGIGSRREMRQLEAEYAVSGSYFMTMLIF